MIDDYEDLNRDETLDAVAGFDGEQLQKFLKFERECKNRVTVLRPLERKLVTVTPAGDSQYIARIWFDGPDDVQTVRRTTRVEAALESDELREVG